jgi:hypothetical protein
MRRPRPHRLTGSVRRLLAASALAALAAAFAVTSAARPVSAAGLGVNLNLGLGSLNLNLPVPILPVPVPSSSAPAPAPSTSAPTLPGGASLPVLCPPNCAANNPVSPNGGTGTKTPANAGSGSASGPSSRSSVGAPTSFGSSSGSGSSATSTLSVPQSVGLVVSPPPPVEQLTPLAGISFGQAPYLWPLFILLDVIAAGAVVLLVRRTWSPTSGAD